MNTYAPYKKKIMSILVLISMILLGGPLYFGYRANILFEQGLSSGISSYGDTFANTFQITNVLTTAPASMSAVVATHLNSYSQRMLGTLVNNTVYQGQIAQITGILSLLNTTVASALVQSAALQTQITQLLAFSTSFNQSTTLQIIIENRFDDFHGSFECFERSHHRFGWNVYANNQVDVSKSCAINIDIIFDSARSITKCTLQTVESLLSNYARS